jgi:hypothetical protein
MRYLKYGLMVGIFVLCAGYASSANAQVAVRVGPFGLAYGPGAAYVGAPPNCAYGYYGYYPYACAPYGYYGPNYFYNGIFMGVGPWYGWGWRGFRGEGGWRDGGGFHSFHGSGAWHGGEGFRGEGGFHSFHGGGGGQFRGGGSFHGGNGGFHGGGGAHGGGHR